MGRCLEDGLYAGSLFSILFLVSAVPRGQDTALLWDATETLMRRDLDSEVVKGTDDGPLPAAAAPLCQVLGQPSCGEKSPGCTYCCLLKTQQKCVFPSSALDFVDLQLLKSQPWPTPWSWGVQSKLT